MSRITSSVGLATGIPIEETVNQLMQISARPRNLLASRTEGLQSEQLALDALSSRILSLQFDANKLASDRIYESTIATSSAPETLSATIARGANPQVGNYTLRPLRTASAQQLVSQRFENLEDALGDGAFSFRVGGFVNQGISLDELNAGAGVRRGAIRITDRSGATADVDLSLARTVDDVLSAINSNTIVSVAAEATGDAIRLTDHTAGAGTLSVTDVGRGTTASDLGLAGVATSAASAVGADVFTLHRGTKLSDLNDQNGVYISDDATELDDLVFNLADGSTGLGVDLTGAVTLGDVIDAVNEDEDLVGKVNAALSADGRRLEFADLTSGAGSFAIADGPLGSAADDLGLTQGTVGGVILGRRLSAGLSDTLLSSLNGGQGLGQLGEITITDRGGGSATVDLSSAETLGDVVELINGSAVGVQASFNVARNGILLADSSGGAGNLTLASADATTSAELLGIAVDDAVASVNSGGLHRQSLSDATLLQSLNGGKGVVVGDVELIDSQGGVRTVSLDSPGNEATTIADVINAINATSANIIARINDAGDGILVTDVAGGSGALSLRDRTGSVARTLRLDRSAETTTGEPPMQTIDGSAKYTVDVSDLAQQVSEIALSSLNGGDGVAAGDFRITDSTGNRTLAIDLNGGDSGIKTVEQLIDAINQKATQLGVGVTASLNAKGTGILLTDTVGGPEKLTVEDVNSTTAADLKLTKAATLNSTTLTQTIDGAGAFSTQSGAQSGIEALAERINSLEAGVTASTLFDGAGYRLVLSAANAGDAGALLIDAGDTSVRFEETSQAQDALLLYGGGASSAAGVLLSSADNSFNNVIEGVRLKVHSASEAPVTVDVARDDEPFFGVVEDFVASFNAIREDLAELTSFDPESATTGLLFGTSAALQVDARLSRIITDRFFGAGSIQSFEQLGLSVDDAGRLQLNSTKLTEALEADSSAVQQFFANEQHGAVAKLTGVIDRLAGDETSALGSRSSNLQRTIETNQQRIEQFNQQLGRERERLLLQFFQLETIISGLQQNLTALDALQPVPPLSAR